MTVNEINISVIIPVYNSEKTIESALDSVLSQTISPYEIILIDDGSQDNTLDKLKLYTNKYSRIKVYTQKNSGPAHARNQGVQYAQGEWIAFLDSDDYWYPFHLEKLTNIILHHPELHWASAAFERQVGQLTIVERLNISHDQEILGSYLSATSKGHPIHTNTVLLRRKTFLQMHGFREDWNVSEDTNLWYRWGIHYPCLGYSHICSSRYNCTPGSITNRERGKNNLVKFRLRSLEAALQYADQSQAMSRHDVQIYLCNQLNAILKTCTVENHRQFSRILREYRIRIPGFSLHWKTLVYYFLSYIPGCSPASILKWIKGWISYR